jgi:hypothetical protein
MINAGFSGGIFLWFWALEMFNEININAGINII